MKLRTKILFMCLGCTFLALILQTAVFYSLSSEFVYDQSKNESENSLRNMQNETYQFVKRIESSMVDIYVEEDFIQALKEEENIRELRQQFFRRAYDIGTNNFETQDGVVALYLYTPEHQIINLDLLTYAGNLENLTEVENAPNYKFIRGDIADRKFVFDLFEKEKPDIIVNFAAESHVDRSIEDPESFVRTNVMGTTTLLDACKEYGIKRFHQVSTDEVYGDLPLDRPDLFFTEETPLHTSSPYSSSKASADLFVMAYHRTFGIPVTISRCSNNYGPYQFPEKLIPLIISRALA